MTTSLRMSWLFAGALLLIAAAGLGYLVGRAKAPAAPVAAVAPTAPPEKTVLYWYDPMVPDQHFDKPGKSPFMDMQLVPRYAEPGAAANTQGVAVSPRARQALGMRTAKVTRGRLPRGPAVPGTVGWDLREERVLSVPVDATLTRLWARTPFERVHAGQALAHIQAPAWAAALAEARALGAAQSGPGVELRAAARARLQALGLPAHARSDGRGGIVLVAPHDGVVTEITAREGQALSAGTTVLRVNGDRRVWVQLALPQSQAGDARPGAVATVTVDAWPDETFTGRVEALLPQVDAATRTQRVRVDVENRESRLAAGMFANVTLEPAGRDEVVLVPSAAVIADGVATRVLVERDDRFQAVSVRTGRSVGGQTEVLEGLDGDETVVVSGQFLIDSEANLSGALERLAPAAGQDAHQGHAP